MSLSIDVTSHLEKEFRAAIQNDLIALVEFHKGGVGGFHSIPREVFCYIDYISAIRYGSNSTTNAIRFIEDYMGKSNTRYRYFGRLLYEMWRHGTVHEFDPKRLRHSNNRYSIGWQTNNDSAKRERGYHLECFKVHESKDTFLLNVNLFELVENFFDSVSLLIDDLKRSTRIRNSCQRHYHKISRAQPVSELERSKKIQRRLNLQISRAVKTQRLEVQDGNVLE